MNYGLYYIIAFFALNSFGQSDGIDHLIQRGEKAFNRGEYDEFQDHFSDAIELARKNDKDLPETYFRLGTFYAKHSMDDIAIRFYLRALNGAKRQNDQELLARIYVVMGGSCYNRMHYTEAKKYWEKSLQISRNSGDKIGVSNSLNNLGELERIQGNYRRALEYYNDAYDIKHARDPTEGEMVVSTNIAACYLELNELDAAKSWLDRALELTDVINRGEVVQYTYLTYGDYYNHIHAPDLAINWYGKVLQSQKEHPNPDDAMNRDIYTKLADTYQEKGNADSALVFQKKATEVMIEMSEREKKTMMVSEEIMDVISDKNAAIAQVKESADQRQKVYLGITLVLIIVVLAVVLISLQRKKVIRQKNQLILQEKELGEAVKKKNEIENKFLKREVSMALLHVVSKNDTLRKVYAALDGNNDLDTGALRSIKNEIRNSLRLDEDWEQFKIHFERVHPTFFVNLSKNYPGLTSEELRLCAYLKINLSTKEIANILNILPTSVHKKRNRLRKKLQLNVDEELSAFLHGIEH